MKMRVPDESHILTEVTRTEPEHELNKNPHHKWKPKSEQKIVQVPKPEVNFTLDHHDIINSMARLMNLSCPRKSEIITGNQGEYKAKGNQGISQEEHINRAELSKEGDHTNQDRKLQERQPPNQTCPRKNIILHHAKASKNVENFSCCKEESFKEIPPDNLLFLGGSTPKMVRTEPTRSMKDHPLKERINSKVHSRGVILSYLLKEEPPDAQSIPKPKQYQVHSRGVILSYLVKEEPPDAQSIPKPKQYQGKTIASQKSTKADLLYLGAAIRSATEPEVNPEPYSTSQGANQDIRALNMPYITNHEGLNDEANLYGFYTQEGVQANWNWAKILTEQEVMNLTSQRFLSPSICEYATLEEDSSKTKNRHEPKPIIGVKRSLSAFQKAQDL
ncbi:hypothetical protein F2Q68_00041019 [Brassica cretica]|uniref:Uncharacterized protein n=1 Tax=Brassica cretica TaxID=69181 RepID=A0A8S9MCD3_BRACR|nr:hypothetical protein F2Q68_00041019 [Brassica cretica]